MCISEEIISLRKVNIKDEDLLFHWANDSDVRKLSFNKKSITLDRHKTWFKQKLSDKNVLIWILEDENSPAGMVRLEKEGDIILLNYLIAPDYRGKKLASKMLKMAMVELNNYWRNVNVLAYTLPENIASIKSLENAGFRLKGSSVEKNCYIFKSKENR